MEVLKKEAIVFVIIFLSAIGVIYAIPLIQFITPTTSNATTTSNTSIEINVSITEANLTEVVYNWNGTNYTIYNDSLLLMYNFDNISSIGDNDTYIIDISSQGNNATIYGSDIQLNLSGGYFGGGVEFDGKTDNNITLNHTIFSNVEYGTISIWFKFLEFPNNGELMLPLLYYGNATTNTTGLIIEIGHFNTSAPFYNGTQIFYTIKTNDSSNSPSFCFDSFINLTVSTWYNFVVTVNSTGNAGYLNGEILANRRNNYGNENSSSVFFSNITDANLFSIGYGKFASLVEGKSWHEFNGTIDELRIWNISLTENEVYQQYISNLNKLNSTQWYLYVNQSKNTTDGLDNATYTYQVFATDNANNTNNTEQRTITIGSASNGNGNPNNGGNTPGGGGGGCTTQWVCDTWSSCINGNQTRNCTKNKSSCYASLSTKPVEIQNCSIEKPEDFPVTSPLEESTQYSDEEARSKEIFSTINIKKGLFFLIPVVIVIIVIILLIRQYKIR